MWRQVIFQKYITEPNENLQQHVITKNKIHHLSKKHIGRNQENGTTDKQTNTNRDVKNMNTQVSKR